MVYMFFRGIKVGHLKMVATSIQKHNKTNCFFMFSYMN